MKYYKSVTARVEQENYKKGVNRIDTESSYYSTAKKLNILSTIWLMFFQFAIIFPNTTALLIYTDNAKNVDRPLYIITWVSFMAVAASLYLIRRKFHLIALILNFVTIFAQIIRISYNDKETVQEILNNGYINSSRFWMFYVPGLLICLFTLVIFLIGLKTRIHFHKDYKSVLAKMYTTYREENSEISDIEWTKHLEELDKELEEKETAEREAAKKAKEKKKKDKKEDKE